MKKTSQFWDFRSNARMLDFINLGNAQTNNKYRERTGRDEKLSLAEGQGYGVVTPLNEHT